MGKLRQTALILGEGPTEFFYFKSLCDVFKRLTNDLAFEYAFDNLGIKYIDGFSGFHHRYFKPETQTQTFVASLPASDYGYILFVPSQRTEDFVYAILQGLKYSGGAYGKLLDIPA